MSGEKKRIIIVMTDYTMMKTRSLLVIKEIVLDTRCEMFTSGGGPDTVSVP